MECSQDGQLFYYGICYNIRFSWKIYEFLYLKRDDIIFIFIFNSIWFFAFLIIFILFVLLSFVDCLFQTIVCLFCIVCDDFLLILLRPGLISLYIYIVSVDTATNLKITSGCFWASYENIIIIIAFDIQDNKVDQKNSFVLRL